MANTTALPVRIGLLYDFPQMGDLFEKALRMGIDEVAATGRLDRDVELIERQSRGLPSGSEAEVARAFQELDDDDVVAIVGPSISDNALIVAPLCDAARIPAINYSGGERARSSLGWDVPVLANSALMFGYARPDWRDGYAGWEYIDTIADDNRSRAQLQERFPHAAGGPIGCAAYDIGRLLGEGIASAEHLTRAGVADGLRRVKQLPASSGHEGTLIGFGVWDHAALKGHYLVLRTWRDGHSVQV